MRRSPFGLSTLLPFVVILAACSGGDGPAAPGSGSGGNGGSGGGGGSGSGAASGTRMSAMIDGQPWSAGSAAGMVVALQTSPKSGGYIITGIEPTPLGALNSSLVFNINLISGPGTYPLGVDAVSVYGGFAGITHGTGATWLTPISGAAGTITITALTTTRIAGTFTFTATPSSNGATGTKVVTNGVFDAPISNNAVMPVLTDSMGGRMSATLAGQSWNAGIIAAGTSPTHFSLSGINDQQTLVLTIPKPGATGTYALSNAPGSLLFAWDPNAVAPAGARCCWGVVGDVGQITFTHLTTTRAKGTFGAVLSPQPNTAARGQLVIVNGSFDVGLYHNP